MSATAKWRLIGLWFLAVIPLTFLGYGSDGDAWRVADAADRMFEQGEYIKSRTAGFPLYELLAVFAQRWSGSLGTNFIAVGFGLILIAALFRLSDQGRLRFPLTTISILLFLPMLLKNASSTMDYVPALSLLVWAFTLAIEGRYVPSAVLVGLACGFRPSSGAFVLPMLLLIVSRTHSYRRAAIYFAISLVVGTLCFSPALVKYGIGYATSPVNLPVGTRVLRGGYRALKVFGSLQSAGVALLVAFTLVAERNALAGRLRASGVLPIVHLTNGLLWVALFLYLPAEPEYLLPLVPSAVLMLDSLLSRRSLLVAAVVLLSYNLIQVELLGGTSGARRLGVSLDYGLIISDIRQRNFALSLRRAATDFRPPRPTMLMYGVEYIAKANKAWTLHRRHGRFEAYRQVGGGQFFVSSLTTDPSILDELSRSGFILVAYSGYIPSLGLATREKYKILVVDDLDRFFESR